MDTVEVNTVEEECEQFGEDLDAGVFKCTVRENEHAREYQECEDLTEESPMEETKDREVEKEFYCKLFKKGYLDCNVCHVCKRLFNDKYKECRRETKKSGEENTWSNPDKLNELTYHRLIRVAEPFKGLFNVDEEKIQQIAEKMREEGFRSEEPVVVWLEKCTVVDGHTRLRAAQIVGVSPEFIRVSFNTEREAIEYCISRSRDRHNRTDAEIVKSVELLDKRKDKRENLKQYRSTESSSEPSDKTSARKTADLVGVSETKVKKIRAILDNADSLTIDSVRRGEKGINSAYQEVQKKNKENGSVQISFRLLSTYHEELKKITETKKMKLSSLLNNIIKTYLKEKERVSISPLDK